MRAILGELDIDPSGTLPPDHRVIGAFEFEGALSHALLVGGADGGGVPEEAARSLARDFVDACVEDHRLNVTVFLFTPPTSRRSGRGRPAAKKPPR